MNNNTKIYSTLAIGVIVIAATISIFFLGMYDKVRIDWLILTFILISEIALFLGVIITAMQNSPTNKVLIRSGIISTLFIYWIVTVLSSIFLRNALIENPNHFLIMNIVLIAVTAIIVISLNISALNTNDKDAKTINSRLFMEDCEKRVFALKANPALMDFRKALEDIYETIKYGDKIGKSSFDEDILKQLISLEDGLKADNIINSDIQKITDGLIFLLNQRNTEMLQAKRGGF